VFRKTSQRRVVSKKSFNNFIIRTTHLKTQPKIKKYSALKASSIATFYQRAFSQKHRPFKEEAMTSNTLRAVRYIAFVMLIALTACNQEQSLDQVNELTETELSTQSLQTVDATNLSAAFFNIKNDPTTQSFNFSNNGVKDLNLTTGNYLFCAPYNRYCLPFSVDSSGDFQYDSSVDAYFEGAGTKALVVTGLEITLETSALSHYRFNLKDELEHQSVIGYNNNGSQTATLLPGDYFFCAPYHTNCLPFSVEVDPNGPDGLISYATPFDTWLSGIGTSTLTVTGFDFTLETSALSHTRFNIMNETLNSMIVGYNNNGTQAVNVLPGNYAFCAPYNTNCIAFSMSSSGVITYDASLDDFFDGNNSTTLTVTGLDFTVDTSLLGQPNFYFTGPTTNNTVGGYNKNLSEAVNLMPGDYHFCSPYVTNCEEFTLTQGTGNTGIVSYDSILEPYFLGQGTSVLKVSDTLPTVLYVDAAAPAGGDGLSETTAFTNLQDALDVAAIYGTVTDLDIAEGVYALPQE